LLVLAFLGLADFLRCRVAARLRGFELKDILAPLPVEHDQTPRFRRQSAARKRMVEDVGMLADKPNVVHR